MSVALVGAVPAFPGAEGFGKWATGGTRLPPEITRPIPIQVIPVTTLADAGPGSLRAAVSMSGPRVVVFHVSGEIVLESPLNIEMGNLTIAGQTAPGGGICVTGYPFGVNADNVVIRFMRFRLGDSNALEADAFGLTPGRRNVIIDHCSVSWGVDETFSVYAVSDVTVQWCFITESLYESVHDKGRHGYGAIWGGNGVSFHHNLFAHHTSRTPRFNGGRYNPSVRELVDFRNNVIYNWGFNSAYGGEVGAQINVVNNYYRSGPATRSSVAYRIVEPTSDRDMSGDVFLDEEGQPYHTGRWYVNGNVVHGSASISVDNWSGGVQGRFADDPEIRMSEPFEVEAITTESAESAFANVLRFGGARLPMRDVLDHRIVIEAGSGTAQFGGVYGSESGIIDTPSDVGGLPVLDAGAVIPADSDADGIPDVWESANGLDDTDPSDAHQMQDDGYTNLEHYLNALAAPAMPPPNGEQPELIFTTGGSGVTVSWPAKFAGFLLERRALPSGNDWDPLPESMTQTTFHLGPDALADSRLYRLRRP